MLIHFIETRLEIQTETACAYKCTVTQTVWRSKHAPTWAHAGQHDQFQPTLITHYTFKSFSFCRWLMLGFISSLLQLAWE